MTRAVRRKAWLTPTCGSPGGKRCAPAAGALFIPFTLAVGQGARPGRQEAVRGRDPQHLLLERHLSQADRRLPARVSRRRPASRSTTTRPGFPVYNQRADLELSTKGSGFDVLNVTFIYTSRWIGAGWLTPLDRLHQGSQQDASRLGLRRFPARVRAADARQGRRGLRHPLDLGRADGGRRPLRSASRPTASACPIRSTSSKRPLQVVNKKDGASRVSVPRTIGAGSSSRLPAGLRRQRLPQSAGRPDAGARHAGGGGGGRVLRQADQFLRPGGRSRLHLRPGDGGAAGRPHQLLHAQSRLLARCSARRAARSPRRRTSP